MSVRVFNGVIAASVKTRRSRMPESSAKRTRQSTRIAGREAVVYTECDENGWEDCEEGETPRKRNKANGALELVGALSSYGLTSADIKNLPGFNGRSDLATLDNNQRSRVLSLFDKIATVAAQEICGNGADEALRLWHDARSDRNATASRITKDLGDMLSGTEKIKAVAQRSKERAALQAVGVGAASGRTAAARDLRVNLKLQSQSTRTTVDEIASAVALVGLPATKLLVLRIDRNHVQDIVAKYQHLKHLVSQVMPDTRTLDIRYLDNEYRRSSARAAEQGSGMSKPVKKFVSAHPLEVSIEYFERMFRAIGADKSSAVRNTPSVPAAAEGLRNDVGDVGDDADVGDDVALVIQAIDLEGDNPTLRDDIDACAIEIYDDEDHDDANDEQLDDVDDDEEEEDGKEVVLEVTRATVLRQVRSQRYQRRKSTETRNLGATTVYASLPQSIRERALRKLACEHRVETPKTMSVAGVEGDENVDPPRQVEAGFAVRSPHSGSQFGQRYMSAKDRKDIIGWFVAGDARKGGKASPGMMRERLVATNPNRLVPSILEIAAFVSKLFQTRAPGGDVQALENELLFTRESITVENVPELATRGILSKATVNILKSFLTSKGEATATGMNKSQLVKHVENVCKRL